MSKKPSAKKNGAKKSSTKFPSPCIGVCKFRRAGHCIGCSMTKDQKKAFKKLKKPALQAGFIQLVMAQQTLMGAYRHWDAAYARRCRKKGLSAETLSDRLGRNRGAQDGGAQDGRAQDKVA